ncbi:MAG: hypothetical protein WC054_14385 [Candidatus Nanopelagicales bacterium]
MKLVNKTLCATMSVALVAASTLASPGVASATTSTVTFTYTGAAVTTEVPADVNQATFVVVGGGGGGSARPDNRASGGRGAVVTSTQTVSPGDTLTISVAGAATPQEAQGGAASAVTLGATPLVVAGGGGGAGYRGTSVQDLFGGAGGNGAADGTAAGGNGWGGNGGDGGANGVGGNGGSPDQQIPGGAIGQDGTNATTPVAGGAGGGNGGKGGDANSTSGGASASVDRGTSRGFGGGGSGFGGGGGAVTVQTFAAGGGGGGYGGGGGGGGMSGNTNTTTRSGGGAGGSFAATASVGSNSFAPGPFVHEGVTYGNDSPRDSLDGSFGLVIITYSGATPPDTGKQAQTPVDCSAWPAKVKSRGKTVLLGTSCSTNANKSVRVRVINKKAARGDIRPSYRVIRKASGRVIIKTFGRPGVVIVKRTAPGNSEFKPYLSKRTYRF